MRDFDALFSQFGDLAFLIAVSLTRIAVAFVVLPLFSQDLIPATVRNSIFVALALIVLVVQPSLDVGSLATADIVAIFVKEGFIGLAIGVFFGIFLWAFESAGMLVDTQVGSSQAMIMDPLSGHEVTLLGELLGRWANYLFMASGGLLMLTGAVLESYAVWPVERILPALQPDGYALFTGEIAGFFTLMIMLCSPVLVVIFLIDMSLGLVNRFAQRFNVLFLSMSLKSLAALLIVAISLPMLMQVLIQQLNDHAAEVQDYLDALFVTS